MKLALIFLALVFAQTLATDLSGTWNVNNCPSNICCPQSMLITGSTTGYTASWTWDQSSACNNVGLYGSLFQDFEYDLSDYDATFSDDYTNGLDVTVQVVMNDNGDSGYIVLFGAKVDISRA